MKLTVDDVKRVLKENEPEIRKFGVKEVYLFGSVCSVSLSLTGFVSDILTT